MEATNPNIRRLLRTILDETWETLRPEERARTSKAMVAQRLINAVAEENATPLVCALRPSLEWSPPHSDFPDRQLIEIAGGDAWLLPAPSVSLSSIQSLTE